MAGEVNDAFCRFFAKASNQSGLSDPSAPLYAAFVFTLACRADSKHAIVKIRKFILSGFWSIIRKLARMKISRYTVVMKYAA